MEISVTFRHTEPVESLRMYAEEKVSKVKKFLDVPLEAHIVLSVEKFRHQADVTVMLNGTRIKAVEETGDMYSAIDMVMDKLERQVRRHLSKVRDRRTDSNRAAESPVTEEEVEEAPVAMEGQPVIEVERVVAKPMDPEEASMQLGLSRDDFLVFRNAKSKEINVLYKLRDGKFGLIEPEK